MTVTSLLPCIEIDPSTSPIASVIWLHGLGAEGSDFVPLVPELNLPANLPIRFVFPHAPMRAVTINNGYVMRAWYDIVSLNIHQRADQQGIDASVKQIGELIEREVALGVPTNKIILAGFSQGAVIALTTGLSYPEPLGGILALSGYLPDPANIQSLASAANKKIPIFLAHGEQDTVVPFMIGEIAHQALLQNQYSVTWHSYPMPHSVCDKEIKDIAQWLEGIL